MTTHLTIRTGKVVTSPNLFLKNIFDTMPYFANTPLTPLSPVKHGTRAVQGEPVGAAARVEVVPEDGRAGRGAHRGADPGEHRPAARRDFV